MRILVAIAFCSMSPAFSRAEIIDRVAVSMENTVITESEVQRQIRLTALLNNETPEFSAEKKQETAERLVDQALIRREIGISRYTSDQKSRGAAMYTEFRKQKTADWPQLLKKFGVSDADVRAAFEWQALFLDFIEVRFRPGVSIPEEELRAWYDEQVKPKSTPEADVSFDEARPRIEQVLTQQRVDAALDRWLGQARTQTRIWYRPEALK